MPACAETRQEYASLATLPALIVNGEELQLDDILRRAKWKAMTAFVEASVDATIIRQAAEQYQLHVTTQELQTAADSFRQAHQLNDAAATTRWLQAHFLSLSDWEQMLEEDVLTRKLQQRLTEFQVEQYFAEHRLAFESAVISHILVVEEDVARELHLQIVEEGAYFYQMARRYSQDAATRQAGGFLGEVRRTTLEATLEAAIFGGEAGQIVGPFKMETGWRLIRIEELRPAVLNEAVREEIAGNLFAAWLAEQRERAEIQRLLLEP